MCSIWGYHSTQHGGERLVNFNQYGQPIGQNKSLFIEFLGTIARNGKYTPIDIKSWDKMLKSFKKNMLEVVQEKFEIPRSYDVWVLQSIGKKWRNWKADVKSKYYDQKMSTELQLCNVPKMILKDQWKNLVTNWNSEESKCISERNKKSRSRKSLMHIIGKRSFSQMREDQVNFICIYICVRLKF
ncbi:uncharacterized protein LOC114581140 [Dendrobium catenatum]|uniref:uncharacterized protein LOC114581140 n=1 Tax=Dendrobium catenatum TaxID=906689 RepID=UPI0010A00DFC|nr:uncharacterized protein LOC114581140 [Dendrobium catenatum]